MDRSLSSLLKRRNFIKNTPHNPMLRVGFLLIVYCYSAVILGQSVNKDNHRFIDSLTALLNDHLTHDQVRVDLLNQLGYEYWIVDPKQSEVYGTEALEIAKLLPYPAGKAFAKRVIGVAHWARGNLELSFTFLVNAEKDYQNLGDSLGLANSMLNLGMAYFDQGKFKTAKAKYVAALALFERRSLNSRIATTYTKLSDLFIAEGDYEQAYDYLRRALDIHHADNFLYGIAEVNSKLGKLATAKEDYHEAISYFMMAIQAGGRRNDHVGLAEYFHG
ncbi:MAG: tetratricopeptide repeat protein, partial [Bacteroidota bacterium]